MFMDLFDLFAQIIGILAMMFNILSYQQKTRARAIAFQLGGAMLFAMNFWMLGAIVGGILNAVAAIRAVVFLNRDKPDLLAGWLCRRVRSFLCADLHCV